MKAGDLVIFQSRPYSKVTLRGILISCKDVTGVRYDKSTYTDRHWDILVDGAIMKVNEKYLTVVNDENLICESDK